MSLTQEQRNTLERMAVDLRAVLEEEEKPDLEPDVRPKVPIWGVDISDHQGPYVNFAGLKSEGYQFCFIKASEGWGPRGSDSRQKYYTESMRRARAAGMVAGAYHFLWGNDPIKQVDTFLDAIGTPEGKMLAVDVETYNGQVPPRKYHLWGFIRELTRRIGKSKPIIVYSGDWFYLSPTMGNPQFKELEQEGIKIKVWSTPNSGYVEGPGFGSVLYREVPDSEWREGFGFGGKPVDILQFSAEVSAANIEPIDCNAFRGTREELLRFATTSAPVETEEGKKLAKKIEDYGEAIIGTPYGIEGGAVEAAAPSWADNAPAPKPSFVKARKANCVGPPNLLRRKCRLTIAFRPSVPENIREKYDGGTWAWAEFFKDEREPFSLKQPNGNPWRPFDLFGKFYGGEELVSQGHLAMMWFNGNLFQSFISNFRTGAPGVNKGVTLKDSHGSGYYDYVVRREVWLPKDVARALDVLEAETPEAQRLFAQAQEEESNPLLLEAMRVYQAWTEGELSEEEIQG